MIFDQMTKYRYPNF